MAYFEFPSCIKLRIVFSEDDVRKLILPSMPDTVSDLCERIKTTFAPCGEFRLQYLDPDFGQFCNLLETSEILDRGTLKVIFTSVHDSDTDVTESLYQELLHCSPKVSANASEPSCASSTVSSNDSLTTMYSSDDTQRSQGWPTEFPIPRFSFDTELKLSKGNKEYEKDRTLLSPAGLISDILEKLAESIFRFKAYPTDLQFNSVARALVRKHPCLKEMGSVCGWYGWKTSLKFKMGNYRTKLRNAGCSELTVNSLKREAGNDKPAKNIKKPRKAEVNYLPDYPSGETAASLEAIRLALIDDMKKRGNDREVKEKMVKTFPYRREEVVYQMPLVINFKQRWPALFTETQVC